MNIGRTKKAYWVLALFSAAFLSLTTSAHGAGSACIDKSKFLDLKKVSEGDLTAVKTQLKNRQDLLRAVLLCAVADAKEMRSQVASLKTANPAEEEIKTAYMDRIDKAIASYKDYISQIDETGVRASQDVAKSVKEWRASEFSSLAENTVNAVVWLKNQEVFRAADVRFANIERTVRALKLLDSEDIAYSFEKAGASMAFARDKNEKARTLLRDFMKPQMVSGSLKESLDNLADAYKSFAEISDAVKAILTPPAR